MNLLLLTDFDVKNCTATITNSTQIQHLRQVLKVNEGDDIRVGVIHGNMGSAKVASIQGDCIKLHQLSLTEPPPPKLELTLVLALPRPKVLRRLIMDITAIGVKQIVLLNSYRTEKSYWQSPMLSRLDEFVQEGLQQALDTVPPAISLKKRFKPFVEDELPVMLQNGTHEVSATINLQNVQAVVAHPYANTSWQEFLSSINMVASNNLSLNNPSSNLTADLTSNCSKLPAMLFIGAEGGWIDYEINLLTQQGCLPVSFGQRILRTEAAVNMCVGQWLSNVN